MAYKLGDRTLFEQNSVHAAFYRDYLKDEFRMERYEWESCGDTSTGKFQKGKTVFIFPFIRPILRSTVRCMQHVLKEAAAPVPIRECPEFCERQAFLYPEHLRMVGRYNSLFGVVLTVLQEPEAMGKMYGLCEMDRIVVNLL